MRFFNHNCVTLRSSCKRRIKPSTSGPLQRPLVTPIGVLLFSGCVIKADGKWSGRDWLLQTPKQQEE